MKKIVFFLFISILFLSFIGRLYRIDSPIADWHSWRQADTASVTRIYVENGIDFLHPKYHDLSKIPSGTDNPQGYRFVEFPIYNATVAMVSQIFDTFTLEVWGRLVTIFASFVSIIFLFLLTRKYAGARTGLFTMFFAGFLPFNIYYSRVILPDPAMVATILGATYFFDKGIEKNSKLLTTNYQLLLAIVLTALAFLLKPFALFFTLPMVYLAYRQWGVKFALKPQLWVFAIVSLIPFVLWRFWIQQYPEGIPASDWLFNEGNIRFKGAFFYWIFADRIGRLILGYWGIALFVLGLVRNKTQKEGLFFYSFLASSLLYLFVIAGGNVKHDYYQILIIPTLTIFLAKGADLLLTASREYFDRVTCYLLLVTCTLFTLGFGWYHVRNYYNINNPEIVEAGKIVDEMTPKDAKVIAAYGGDTAFLYQTKRQGWPVVTDPIDVMAQKGATHLAVVNPDEGARNLLHQYKIIYQSDKFLLFDLHAKIQ